jgi:Rho-binding antiterminator
MISCDVHDYVEIACMFRLSITLIDKSGEAVSGIALDTQYDSNKDECLELAINNETVLIKLDSLISMIANQPNPHFKNVSFID